jgi:branched-chain amino acid transport system ATP-binding protein
MLSVKNLDVVYDKTKAVKNVSLRVDQGQVVTVLGSNGAGKTTTLRAISGLVTPKAGEIIYRDKSIFGKKSHEIVKAGIVQVSQERDLFPELSVIENLRLGALLLTDKGKMAEKLEEIFGNFPRLKERRRQKAGSLSGGEQQMVAIGRALMGNPILLLLDEPSVGLSPIFVKHIMGLLRKLRDSGMTMLLVEQNAPVAVSLAHYFYVLRNGEIVTEGDTGSLPSNINEFLAKYYI